MARNTHNTLGYRRKTALNERAQSLTAQELCVSPGGRPGLPVPNSPDGL